MNETKTSFEPLSAPDIRVLLLGSLPGDKSLEVEEYYGHPRNRFWKVLSTIFKQSLPADYPEKKAMLRRLKVGVWDVAQQASRKGSLDSAIANEVPNELDQFIDQHHKLRIIAFNGKKAEAMFDQYFKRRAEIQYLSLPSTSPANAAFTFEQLCTHWSQLFA